MALPAVFIVLAALALVTVIGLLWQSFRAIEGTAAVDPVRRDDLLSPDRRALLERKAALLQSLRDLSFDHEAGKISQEDFERLDEQFRADARDVLQALDVEVAPYREKAEALLAERLARGPAAPAAPPSTDDQGAPPALGQACAACSGTNDPDARFCKHCGARLPGEAPAAQRRADAHDDAPVDRSTAHVSRGGAPSPGGEVA
ncbi:MAG: zinc ribbon domain-containing protein [Myxococcales bacterium]|nr:zinc ribbon domain-containing protein [Myxococcales bacterium]